MTIQIPDDLAQGLERIATAQHKSVEQVALESLRSVCEPPGSPAAVLRMLREMPRASPEAVDELEAAIAAGRRTVRDEGVFDDLIVE